MIMCTNPGCKNRSCIAERQLLALLMEEQFKNTKCQVEKVQFEKEVPVNKAVLDISLAPMIVKTARMLDPGTVFVSARGHAYLRTAGHVVTLEGESAFVSVLLDDRMYQEGTVLAGGIVAHRIVGPLEISRS